MENEQEEIVAESIDELLSKMTPEQREMQLLAFLQLQQSERFVEFVNENFEFNTVVDHETKRIQLTLEEKPPVTKTFMVNDEVASRLAVFVKHDHKISNPKEFITRFFNIINGKDDGPSLIVGASNEDVSKEVAAQRVSNLIVKD